MPYSVTETKTGPRSSEFRVYKVGEGLLGLYDTLADAEKRIKDNAGEYPMVMPELLYDERGKRRTESR